MTKQLADALFALRSDDGLRFDSFVARLDSSWLAITLRYEGEFVWVELDRPIRIDHSSSVVDKLTDGYLHRLRFDATGAGVAYCEIRGPVGYSKMIEKPL